MSKPKPLVEIPPEIEAEMTPAVKAFVLVAFARLEARISDLESQVRDLTNQVARSLGQGTKSDAR